MIDNDDFDEELLPSKSQVKRECDAIQKLGEDLIALKQEELNLLDLPDELVEKMLEVMICS